MARKPMKQVAVRMSPLLHRTAIKEAKRQKVSFGEFVRFAVDRQIDTCWEWSAPVVEDSNPIKGSPTR
jgi:hypothetical protein